MQKKESKEIIQYNSELQQLLLEFIINSQTLFTISQNIIKPEYWDSPLKPAVRYIINFTNEYLMLPTIEQLYAETGIQLNNFTKADEQQGWFLETIESFCRHKAMEILIMDGPLLLSEGKYAELESRSKENMLISLQKELGTDYFKDPLGRLTKMKDKSNMVSTGWKSIDSKLFGGFNRGELSFFAGGSGSGKSLFLQNLALNWVQQGKNVVYISLELGEELVGLRIDAMITNLSTSQVFKDIENVALRLGIISKNNNSGKKWGKLQIKKMSEAGTTVNDIKAYLKEYEIQSGIRLDAILVDYLDLLYPNNGKVDINSAFNKDKYTSEELRSLVSEYNILAATASQLNRSSVQSQDFDHSHIAGGISKINTADNVMSIYTDSTMKENGEYKIKFLKTRSSSGINQEVILRYDKESLRITDIEENGEYKTTSLLNKNKIKDNNVSNKVSNTESKTKDIVSRIRDRVKRTDD